MPRGRKPIDLPPYDPEQYVIHSRGMRTKWHPDVIPAFLAWLLMMQTRTQQQLRELQSRSMKLPKNVLDGAVAQLRAQDNALTMLAEAATQGWSRQEWFGAVARTMPHCIPADDVTGAPPAKTG